MSLTYTQFIEKVGNQQFRKCLNNELKHFDFHYKIGLNEDIIPFNPSGSCKLGGLYFTTNEHISKFWTKYSDFRVMQRC